MARGQMDGSNEPLPCRSSESIPMEIDSPYVQSIHRLLLVQQQQALFRARHEAYAVTTPSHGNLQGVANIVWLDPISALLVVCPVGIWAYFVRWGDVATFWLNFVAMVPLAKILGDTTEELAAGLKNQAIGGLMSVTFGNAVELILILQTLHAGHLRVVKGTLLGSVLSNLLLVLGTSFFLGGLATASRRRDGRGACKEQEFNRGAALTNMTMLFLAASVLALPSFLFQSPAVAAHGDEERSDMILSVSRYCSAYVLCAYAAFLVFQLYTHAGGTRQEDHEDVVAHLHPGVAGVLLFVTTCFVALASKAVVDSMDGLMRAWGLSGAFVGMILLPMVGNACEHVGAVRMAMAEKLDITIGIAVGSSTQITLLLVPVAVLAGWAIGQPMDLDFGMLDSVVMTCAVIITFSTVSDGVSNWFEGYMLMMAYAVVATLFWFIPLEFA